jgi:transcriptional regulator with XRE-family HTH domain
MADTLGEYIRSVRKSKKPKVTQVDLAKVADVTKAYISMIENARNPGTEEAPHVSLDVLKGIAKGLDVPVEELVNRAHHIVPEGYTVIRVGEQPATMQPDIQGPSIDHPIIESLIRAGVTRLTPPRQEAVVEFTSFQMQMQMNEPPPLDLSEEPPEDRRMAASSHNMNPERLRRQEEEIRDIESAEPIEGVQEFDDEEEDT